MRVWKVIQLTHDLPTQLARIKNTLTTYVFRVFYVSYGICEQVLPVSCFAVSVLGSAARAWTPHPKHPKPAKLRGSASFIE